MNRAHRTLVGVLLGMLCFGGSVDAQTASPKAPVPTLADTGMTKAQLLNALKLSSATVALESSREEWVNKKRELEIAEELFNEKIYTLKEYNDAQKAYERASVAYKQAQLALRETRLGFLRDATHISVTEAKKTYSEGRRMVKVTLKNMSNESEAAAYLAGSTEATVTQDVEIAGLDALDAHMSEERLRSLLEVQNIIVSIYKGQAIIGKPYDQFVPSLKLGEERTLTFQLLGAEEEEIDQVTIQMSYLDVTRPVPVVLEVGSEEDIPIIEAVQFSQEVDLGENATFSLSVERFSSGQAAFQLAVLNLPRQISCQFMDARSNARLSQVSFRQNERNHTLSLQVYLPDRSDSLVTIDKRIEFYALVLPREEWRDLLPRQGEHFSQSEVEGLNAKYAKLELLPRGVGRIEVRAVNLYHEVKTDEHVEMEVTVLNDGTRRLDNISIRANLPPNWRSTVEPDVIPVLMPAKEEVIKLAFLPPEGVGVGDYEIQVQTTALADNRPVETQDKTVRIHVSARTNLLLSAVLVLSVIGLVIGIVWYGVKLTRR